ncbi:hypothetical protein Acr_14g0002840 [Actinidia rufa]|uniref:Uncharacterized protein n=1 Tax=Actinidia rufa TaxID=165716 RepID=A0A7J0FPK7_9ERIC|nr:hypothetical protein Acr_14g0002840 [Actinidia rufa]
MEGLAEIEMLLRQTTIGAEDLLLAQNDLGLSGSVRVGVDLDSSDPGLGNRVSGF